MKKLFILSISAIMLASCSNESNESKETSENTTEQSTEESTNKDEASSDSEKNSNEEDADAKEKDDDKESSSDDKEEIKDAKALYEKIKEKSAAVDSYTTEVTTTTISGEEEFVTKMNTEVGKGKNSITTLEMQGQQLKLLTFDDKLVAEIEGGNFIDITDDSNLPKGITDVQTYEEVVEANEYLKDGDIKEVDGKYEVTVKFDNKEDFKKMLDSVNSGMKSMVDSAMENIEDVNGEVKYVINDEFMLESANTDSKLTVKQGEESVKLTSKSDIKYSNHGEVGSIEIPDKAKNAKSKEQLMKDQENSPEEPKDSSTKEESKEEKNS